MSQKAKAKPAPKKAPAKAAPKKTQTTLKTKPAAKKKGKADSEDENSDVQMSDDDDSLLSHTPPKAKKAAAPKKAGTKPLADVENESFGGDAAGESKSGSAGEKYQKVSTPTEIRPRDFAQRKKDRSIVKANLLVSSLPNSSTSSSVLIPTSVPSKPPPRPCGCTIPRPN